MTLITVQLDWTYEHYLTYVLFIVAGVDSLISSEELDEIEKIIVSENTSSLSYQKIKEDVSSIISLQKTALEQKNFIKTHKNVFLDSEDKKDHILSCIEDVIASDLSINPNELLTFREIKIIISK